MATKHLVIAVLLAACQKPAPQPAPPAPPPTAANPHAFLEGEGARLPEPVAPPSAALRAPSALATRTESGLYTEVLARGRSGERPTRRDVVVMTMDAWDASGRYLEGYTTNEAFTLARGMPGMIEGLTLMARGEKRRMWISPELQGEFALAPGPIVIEVELVEIVRG